MTSSFCYFLNNPFRPVLSSGKWNGRIANSTGNFMWGEYLCISQHTWQLCIHHLELPGRHQAARLPAVDYLGWLGKFGFRLWSIAPLMTSWGSGPVSSPQCQLRQAMGSQHQLGKRSRRVPGIEAEKGDSSQGGKRHPKRLKAKERQAKGWAAHPYQPNDLGEDF